LSRLFFQGFNSRPIKYSSHEVTNLGMLAQLIAVHQRDFGTAIDYLQQSEAILRRIGSPDADTVAEILQQVRGLMN
jgi:hypothetical protein